MKALCSSVCVLRTLALFAGFLVFSSPGKFSAFAGELDNPPAEWIFASGWETSVGTSRAAITDGGRWPDYKEDANISVVSNPPPGGPGGNALKIRWDKYGAADCSGGSNSFIELFPQLPNPYYCRVYFYSEDPREYTGCGGRKFFHFKNSAGYAVGGGLYLYDGGGKNVRLHIKNHVYDGKSNTPTAEHLDGSFPWPGRESEGIVEPNKWYCIEFAHYRHNTNGWLKAWLDGELVINASKEAWGVASYDTDTGRTTDWLQMPSYRNGGCLTTHNEYFDNFVISSKYIGCVPGGSGSTQLSINDLSPSYLAIGRVRVDETAYVDRDYAILPGYPPEYEGLALIKTACDDKGNAADDYLSFEVDKHVAVYVCFEQTEVPLWLSTNFSETGDTIARTGRTHDIWSKKFPPGRITLGGSSAEGAGEIHATYFVIVGEVPAPPTGLTIFK